MADGHESRHLPQVFGLTFGIAAVAGGVIGQGILRTPGLVAGALGDADLILAFWLLGGAHAALSAMVMVELGTAMPGAGGHFDFAGRAFGRDAGILAGWTKWISSLASLAMMVTVTAEFLQRLPAFATLPAGMLATGLFAMLAGINWFGSRVGGVSQTVLVSAKVAGLLLLAMLFLFGAGTAPPGHPPAAAPALTIAGLAIASRAVVATYQGWGHSVFFSGELRDPGRTLPRAIFGGIALVTLLYLLVNLGLLRVLGTHGVAASKLPAADAAAVLLGPWADTVLTLFAIVSATAMASLLLMVGMRVAFAMSLGGALPPVLGRVSASGTPRPALTATAAIVLLFLLSGGYQQLLATSVALVAALDVLAAIVLLRLRRTEPALARPWRVPLAPWSVLLSIVVNLALLIALIGEDPAHTLLGGVVIAAIAVIYAAQRRFTSRGRRYA
jgi:basic amino acid/polyamine antiporter, APA family